MADVQQMEKMNLWIQIDSVKQPVKNNSVSSGYMSHCWTSASDDHFDHCFVVLKKCRASRRIEKTSRSTNHNQHYTVQECRAGLKSWFGSCLMECCATNFPVLYLWISLVGLGKNGTLQHPNPQKSRAAIPSMRKPASREKNSASVELCETDVCFLHIQLMGSSVWLPNMYKIHPEVDFESSRYLRQSPSPETVPSCILVQCFPHGNIVWIHSCDECKRSNVPNVCHKLWSIWWLIEQVCLLTERNICAKILNSTAPSFCRGTDKSCRSNLIIFFDTSKQLVSNGPGSTSIHSRWSYGNAVVEEVAGVAACFGLASATSFPVLSLKSMWSSWVSSVISVTYLFIPFTIMTQEQVSSPNKDVLSTWASQFVQFRTVVGRAVLSPRHGLRDTYFGA